MTKDEKRLLLIEEIQTLAGAKLSGDELSDFGVFLKGFYPASSPDDLIAMGAENLLSIALGLWKTARKKKETNPILKIIKPKKQPDGSEGHTVLHILNKDMPFLVDSITGTLAVILRYRIHMMHHPIVDVSRDNKGNRVSQGTEGAKDLRESYMYIEIDAQSDKSVLAEMEAAILSVLADVRQCVNDWRGMVAKIDETVASLTVNPPPLSDEDVDETIRFLRWLGDDHFTFLGFREYRFEGKNSHFDFSHVEGSGLGILRDRHRNVLRDRSGLTPMSAEIRHFLAQPEPVIITKANVKSTVHRPTHMDYIGVKIFDTKGKAIGERRFVGLFTSLSYSKFARDVPLLRNKVANINKRTLFAERSYAGKAVNHILETFPRDELFQISEDRLFDTTMGILQLTERPRPRAFLRPDRFERFVSALVYVPRENYHSGLREAVADILCDAFNGEVSVYYAQLSEASLARWHFIIRTKPSEVPVVDENEINDLIADAALGWSDCLRRELVTRHGEEIGNRLNYEYRDRFTVAYCDSFTPAQAAYDIAKLEEIKPDDQLKVDFYRHLADGANHFRLKIYHGSAMVTLSDCMPVLENMGFSVLGEYSYALGDGSGGFIHDFTMRVGTEIPYELKRIKPLVENLYMKVWAGAAEDDGFNKLVLVAGMSWNEIVILRAYGKYLRQLGMGYTPDYIADCVVANPEIAAQLVSLFTVQFDTQYNKKNRDHTAKNFASEIRHKLEKVVSLDEDRILRAYLNVIRSTLRTNYYQPSVMEGFGSDNSELALAFKIRSRDVEEAPLPRPYAEIWVYSPRVEGVHLRGGPVARGGLRWSDRREDFRTEVLGLVKAQQVKNAVIVPQGSKGGFYPKQLSNMSDRDTFMAEGVASYRSFITSLLSLTDNLKGGKVVPPEALVRRDSDDPYLVVAADKGTATFSDISNGISQGRGFWLDDAFASGGSNGYDHKKMGITAKGAWISVQRHFRELGLNVQKDEFTVVGVGDMSGDVFGNGMLLSKTIRLKAAFNHMHIFIDPNPGDTKAAWTERKRMFDMPRSSWEDYDQSLISKGGGIFSRSEKSIKLTPEIKEWLGVDNDTMAPNVLLHKILKAEADLMWFGGIGTYIRASDESDSQVGDRANDSLRVIADEVNCKVIGEGGNLGMTHKSRIEFARKGGRCNTDFIDNSAGVDCSDKEVNIKILLTDAITRGSLKAEDRNALLDSMTDEVSDIVLSDNYLQTQAISLAENNAVSAREYHLGLIRALERDGDLNREIEYLPSDEGFAELAANEQGLTRPEISILLAYAKISLSEILMRGTLIDDPVLLPELNWGFPTALRERFKAEIADHRLRREIVSTVLANEVVNWGGLTFVYEVKEETGLAVEDIVAAFVVVREIFGLKTRWHQVNALDYQVDSTAQYDMHQSMSDSLKTQVLWMLRNLIQPYNIGDMIARYKDAVVTLFDLPAEVLSASAFEGHSVHVKAYCDKGVGKDLAGFVSTFHVLRSGADIIRIAEDTNKSVDYVAQVHFAIGDMLGLDWLSQRASRLQLEDHWEDLAIRSLIEDMADQQRTHVAAVCAGAGKKSASSALQAWCETEATKLIRVERLVDELKSSGAMSVAKLSFAAKHLRSILR